MSDQPTVACPTCGGTGDKQYYAELVDCPTCHGIGRVPKVAEHYPNDNCGATTVEERKAHYAGLPPEHFAAPEDIKPAPEPFEAVAKTHLEASYFSALVVRNLDTGEYEQGRSLDEATGYHLKPILAAHNQALEAAVREAQYLGAYDELKYLQNNGYLKPEAQRYFDARMDKLELELGVTPIRHQLQHPSNKEDDK